MRLDRFHFGQRQAKRTFAADAFQSSIVGISNRHLDLLPVLAGHARTFDLAMVNVDTKADFERGLNATAWVMMSRAPASLEIEQLQAAKLPIGDREVEWTDNRNSLFEIMR